MVRAASGVSPDEPVRVDDMANRAWMATIHRGRLTGVSPVGVERPGGMAEMAHQAVPAMSATLEHPARWVARLREVRMPQVSQVS